ncbi:hypothetical protein TNCV_488191 [Trichonephila clavipes]|nr:hypothetical protein TNCV_488191 [Trichonephila clavipes]
MLQQGGRHVLVPTKFFGLSSSFYSSTNFYTPVGTKNVEFSLIPSNLLSMLNFLKLKSKNLVGTVKQRALQRVYMLLWPARSPDISPIENIWDITGHQLQNHPQ